METYYGTYERFDTSSKKDAALLLGADNLVGDRYEIEIELTGGEHKAWLKNRFDQRVGFFGPAFSRQLSLLKAKGLTLTALLAFVAFTEDSESGHYWGEMALFAYPPSESSSFDAFISTISNRLAEGIRPDISLSEDGVDHVLESNGTWTPEKTLPRPKEPKGTVILKYRRSMSERMIEQGRKGNKGCYVLSWVFLLALVAAVIFGLHSCGLF